jgi:hypothetical protein
MRGGGRNFNHKPPGLFLSALHKALSSQSHKTFLRASRNPAYKLTTLDSGTSQTHDLRGRMILVRGQFENGKFRLRKSRLPLIKQSLKRAPLLIWHCRIRGSTWAKFSCLSAC